ncbi:MAG: YitT family protein [Lachnospiraceae bacterium]|nr:YitT family protein [Lachnospiraceae bacterium]
MKNFFFKTGKLNTFFDILLGTFLLAASVVWFFDAVGVVVGGVSGIAIIIKATMDVPMWVINIAFNLPLFIAAYKILDIGMFFRTVLGTVFLTIWLGILPYVNLLTGNLFVDMLAGSVLMGAGLGLIFVSNSSSGGGDLLATLINRKLRHLSIPKIMAVIDIVIVLAGAQVFGVDKIMYSIIGIFVLTRVSDMIIEGPNRAKLLYIISEKNDEVVKYIVETMERGATYIDTEGAFTHKSSKMIMCVVSGKEMVKLKQIIYKLDENAICFVGDIREAFGEGFTKFRG